MALAFLAATGSPLATTNVAHAAGLSVNDLDHGSTAAGLANALVGTGVSISNVTYTGSTRAAGQFTGGEGIIGFDSGIILDSGKVQTLPTDPTCNQGVEGPNTCHEDAGSGPGVDGSSNSTGFGLPGDTDLTSLSGFPTFDASVLQFDFVPAFSTVQFKYVFSSEEYSDFSNTPFNDVFGFFVNGTNCALVPGTNQPVSVNTINNGNDAGLDPTPHNPSLFRDNVRPTPTINTQMDGLTVVLTCNATVKPGVSNHMKLAIADASDDILDSAVFIQAGSLISGTVLNTSLSGGGQSGPIITVPTGTAVTDSGTLSGANAPNAGGTVTYQVFSDATCSTLFANAGTKTVANGSIPNSDPVTFNTTGTFYFQAAYSGDASNNASTSACGSENVTVTGGVVDTTPPSCTLTAVIAGPPKQLQITVQDSGSGLNSIVVTEQSNATVAIPGVTPGTKDALVVTATKVDQTQGASVTLQVTDVAGNVTTCDPELVTVSAHPGHPTSKVITGVAKAESTITIHNNTPGLQQLDVKVNGQMFKVTHLRDGEVRTISVASAMTNNRNNNTIVLTPRGTSGSADVLISDVAMHTPAHWAVHHHVTDRVEPNESTDLD